MVDGFKAELEQVLLEYIMRYGMTQRAREFFRRYPNGPDEDADAQPG